MSNTPLPECKMAPVQGWPQGIPWSLHLEAYAAYCKKWSPQPALIEGWCRGGFGIKELDEFIPGWRERASEIVQLRCELAYAAAVSADLRADNTRLQNEVVMPLRERVRVLEGALRTVRQYPEFDGGGPMADMIDEVLADKAARAALGDKI